MAEDAWGGMRAGGNLFQVRAADAAGVHADQQLSGADLRDGNGLEADVIDAAVNRGQHGRGNRLASGRRLRFVRQFPSVSLDESSPSEAFFR